ncbi:hydrolase [Pseudooceanicola lipolyticus]|uniref:Hydrolase n=1 Tax=Pseudooceanicola lipolyticus TaxID=2029104 RepID=A0A2M8IU00_9RHOB|nr:cell wall hydrolase [Pseudooceanicola lipolyticus]PJE34009.1 hydrolase [Pseudooceanicola lipolyticus]
MKPFLIAAAMAGALILPSAASAEADLKDLFRQEQNSLDNLSGRHLRSLLTVSAPRSKTRPESISFTKDWVDGLPPAAGDEEWRCLAEALYFEARGETVKGQFAVAEVIMNRVNSSRFPATLCGVINQGTGRKYQCQFTYTCDGYKEIIAEPKAFERVAKVARAVLDGVTVGLTGGATYYHTTAVRPKWSRTYKQTARIGVHVFYRPNYRTASSE